MFCKLKKEMELLFFQYVIKTQSNITYVKIGNTVNQYSHYLSC